MTNPPVTILVIENHVPLADLLKEILQRELRVQVREANCLQAALTMLAVVPPDMIVLDCDIPDASGLQAIALLRQNAPQSRIICLHEDERRYHQAALRRGAHACVRKELVATDLIPAVIQVLSN